MGRPKASARKQQSRGVDFKKIKRKIGRKLPPPKNATNTEIKSKAIILPEQSVVAEKAGLAVSNKGLTLKELLQQTSHYNSKVRKDALLGIRDLFLKYPEELRLHRLAVIEKLRERISDDDKLVRETLYQLFKSIILPGCKEDNQAALISLIMAYVFNAITHLSIDVRLMAFKFLDLVVQHYPLAFSSNAEKVLQNYEDIIRKNHFHLQEKGKLKIVLSGLVHCLSLLQSNLKGDESFGKNTVDLAMLHAFEPDLPNDPAGSFSIIGKLKDLVPVLVNCFDEFIPWVHSQPVLDAQSFDCMLSILNSVDLAVKYLVYGNGKYRQEQHVSMPSPVASDASLEEQKISPLQMKKLFAVFPLKGMHHLSEKGDDRYFILNILLSEIFLNFSRWICPPPMLLEKFLEFIEYLLSGEIWSGKRSGKAVNEKHILSLLPFIPKLVSSVEHSWKARLLKAFTRAFKGCNPKSAMKMACLSVVEEMLIPKQKLMYLDATDPELLGHQMTWIRELPQLLISLGDVNPSCSLVVLRLLLHVGQFGLSNPYLAEEYDNIQFSLQEFYSTQLDDGGICYGPFVRLPKDSQELSICCVYYFSFVDPCLLKSIVACCLWQDLEPFVLFRILEVLHSAYKVGRIPFADHISFFTTIVSQFEVPPEKAYPEKENEARISRQATLKSVTSCVCSFLCQMGDKALVLQMLEKVVVDITSIRSSLENTCAVLRMLTVVDSKPTHLSEQSITKLSKILLGYLINTAANFPEDDDECNINNFIHSYHYYLLPCFFLFDRSVKLLKLVLDMLESLTLDWDPTPFSHYDTRIASDHLRRIRATVAVLLMISKNTKVQRLLSSCQLEMNRVLQGILSLQSTAEANMKIEERHKTRCAVERLKNVISAISSGIS
ncbi:hypothetical protein Ancab_004039 [Ancistrocladus abbreviatus]